jgi:hypothetical protein
MKKCAPNTILSDRLSLEGVSTLLFLSNQIRGRQRPLADTAIRAQDIGQFLV